MSETIELHGGPRHGELMELEVSGASKVEVRTTYTVEGIKVRRVGQYTRVFSIAGTSTFSFEWAGFTSAPQPVFVEDEPHDA